MFRERRESRCSLTGLRRSRSSPKTSPTVFRRYNLTVTSHTVTYDTTCKRDSTSRTLVSRLVTAAVLPKIADKQLHFRSNGAMRLSVVQHRDFTGRLHLGRVASPDRCACASLEMKGATLTATLSYPHDDKKKRPDRPRSYRIARARLAANG